MKTLKKILRAVIAFFVVLKSKNNSLVVFGLADEKLYKQVNYIKTKDGDFINIRLIFKKLSK